MPTKLIRKRADPTAARLRRIRDGKENGLVFCEGAKLVDELLASGFATDALYCTAATEAYGRSLLTSRKRVDLPIVVLEPDVMSFVSDVTSPPGLIAIARRPPAADFTQPLPAGSLVLVLHGLQLPQNVGALIRTAEAAGVQQVWTTPTTADPFGPKAVRGSTGSAFRIPFRTALTFSDAVDQLHRSKVVVAAASQTGKVDYDQFNWNRSVALIVGSEGGGFSADEKRAFDETVRIPMSGKTESLNAGVAAAVCLFEAARQKRTQKGTSA